MHKSSSNCNKRLFETVDRCSWCWSTIHSASGFSYQTKLQGTDNFNLMSKIWSYFSSFIGYDTDLDEEKIEELKMLSGFHPKDIVRLRKLFLELTNGSETMSKEVFCKIEGIALNPLLDRICECFGLSTGQSTLSFESFLIGTAAFNAPGRGEVKLRTAFRIQDFDGDGMISKEDLTEYMKRVTSAGGLGEGEIEEIVNEVFRETSSDVKHEFISYSDYQRVVILLDFQAKINLPL